MTIRHRSVPWRVVLAREGSRWRDSRSIGRNRPAGWRRSAHSLDQICRPRPDEKERPVGWKTRRAFCTSRALRPPGMCSPT